MIDEFSFCKEHYFRELDRKAALTNALALPIGISTLISSGLVYVAKEIGVVSSRTDLFITSLLLAGTIFLLIAIVCLCKSYLGYTYQYIPAYADLQSYRTKLQGYYHGKPNADDLSEVDVNTYVFEKISISAQNNFDNNNRKSGYIYLANRALVVALAFLLLAVIPISFGEFNLTFESIKTIIKGS